ncbi:MAG: PIG-L family deacetylase [Actinobacteria bacterium]|nr:MAG: PIG-L family deacetylase [Actinomycetota bacterium]
MSDEPGQPLRHPGRGRGLNLPVPAVALAIGAHPDDVEFGAGGTLAKWAAAGAVIHHVVCTDGSKGTWDVTADTAGLVARRQDEQRAAAKALGSRGEVVFLGWTDGELDSGLAQRAEVARWIRELRPDVVLGHDPWRRYRLHPDHRHAGLLACEGIVAARDPHFFPEQGVPHHRPTHLLLWEADAPNHAEDVTDSLEAKLAALECHASQFESTMHASGPDELEKLEAFRSRVRQRLGEQGRRVGVAHAETFTLIDRL